MVRQAYFFFELCYREENEVCSCSLQTYKDHWMNLNGFQLDTEVILELLWCLAVLSGELRGVCRSVWVVASV